uniref:SLPTX15 n=1 Tax=Scolopendra viridis TaxID=118503 RepID=A0A4D5R9Z4_SCOVI
MKSFIFFFLLATFIVMAFTYKEEISVEPIRHIKKNPSESECVQHCANSFTSGDASKIQKAENFEDFYCNCHIIVE